jgi:hypothetical protein
MALRTARPVRLLSNQSTGAVSTKRAERLPKGVSVGNARWLSLAPVRENGAVAPSSSLCGSIGSAAADLARDSERDISAIVGVPDVRRPGSATARGSEVLATSLERDPQPRRRPTFHPRLRRPPSRSTTCGPTSAMKCLHLAFRSLDPSDRDPTTLSNHRKPVRHLRETAQPQQHTNRAPTLLHPSSDSPLPSRPRRDGKHRPRTH